MKKIFLTNLLLIFAAIASAQSVSIFEKGSLFGLKNSNNKIIVKPVYDYMYPLREKLFLVEKDKKIGVISDDGKTVLQTIFDDVQNLGENYFIVCDKNRWGVLDKYQRIVIPVEYSGIEQLSDYLFVINKGDKKGIINKAGEIVLSATYDDISNFNEFSYILKNDGFISLIDNLGHPILSGNFNALEKLSVPNLYKITSGNKYGIIDTSGKSIAQPIFDKIDCSNPDFIVLEKDKKIGFIVNYKLIPAVYDKITYIQPELGVIAVKAGKLNGFITTNGLIVHPIYDNMSRFAGNGHAFVEKRGKLMYVDVTGKEKTMQEVSGNVRF